jgi:DNA-binding GntR family transcriptional regulator
VSDTPRAADPDVVARLAASLRGRFRTVEDMTQSFIRAAITQGLFRPGERIDLALVGSTLGVSRMPIRVSLRLLEGEGLLTIHPYRGAVVTALGVREIEGIYELRVLLESYLLENAMRGLDPPILDGLRAIAADAEDTDDPRRRLDRCHDFYTALYARADRPRALARVTHLRRTVGRHLQVQCVEDRPVHLGLLPLLEAGDPEGARAWLATHLTGVSSRLQKVVGNDA